MSFLDRLQSNYRTSAAQTALRLLQRASEPYRATAISKDGINVTVISSNGQDVVRNYGGDIPLGEAVIVSPGGTISGARTTIN